MHTVSHIIFCRVITSYCVLTPYRTRIKAHRDQITAQLHSDWSEAYSESVAEAKYDLVVNKVTYALLCPRTPAFQHGGLIT